MTSRSHEALTGPRSGLGLVPGSVAVAEHDERWHSAYAAVEPEIVQALAGLDAQVVHIGSTSVPGMVAKPVLDIAVGAPPPVDNDEYVERLERTCFTFHSDLGIYGGLLFTVERDDGAVVSHLHVVDRDDFQWRWYLAFRDGLRADETLRREYDALKRAAASAHPEDRDRYNKEKFDWVLAKASALGDG